MTHVQLRNLDNKRITKVVTDAIETICVLTATDLGQLTQRFLGEKVNSIKELTYEKAAALVDDYIDICEETEG